MMALSINIKEDDMSIHDKITPSQLYDLGLLDQDAYLNLYREEYSKEIKQTALTIHTLFCPECITGKDCEFKDSDIHLTEVPEHVSKLMDTVIDIMRELKIWEVHELTPILARANNAMKTFASIGASPSLFNLTERAVSLTQKRIHQYQVRNQ